MSTAAARCGWILTLILTFVWSDHASAELEICSRSSIYILDLSTLASLHGFPKCDLNRIKADPTNGVVYLGDKGPKEKVDHIFGTHSAPWYLYKAIQNSDCETDEIENADMVYVYDYCYYTWWLAHVHSLGREQTDTPGDYLIRGWSAMIQLPRWKRNGGRDFIFYDSHPGFVSGHSAPTFNGMLCNEFRHSTHLVVERAQRNTCQSYLEINKQIITPYVPNVVNTSDPLETFLRPSIPRNKRDILVFFSGKCIPYRGKNTGKKMRYALVQALKDAGEDTDVQCTENEQGHVHQDFQVMLQKMERSVFCLVVPGDAQSTRRLSEIFMAGCIPVFVGPPYNTMPLPDDVHYKSIGVFFNITTYHSWLPTQMQWVIGSERAQYAQEARWWIPDADVYEQMITIDTIADIMGHLRGMPDSEVDRKLKEMQLERLRFTFQIIKLQAIPSLKFEDCTCKGDPDEDQNAIKTIFHRLAINIASGAYNNMNSSGETTASRYTGNSDWLDEPLYKKSQKVKGSITATVTSKANDSDKDEQKNSSSSAKTGLYSSHTLLEEENESKKKSIDSNPETRHVSDKFKEMEEVSRIKDSIAATLKKPSKKLTKKLTKKVEIEDADEKDEISTEADEPLETNKSKANSRIGQFWLTSQSQSQTGLHKELAGAIRIGGESWQPFDIELAHKPTSSARQA